MKRLLIVTLIGSAIFIAIGCKLNMTSDLYISDLQEVAFKDTKQLLTPMTIAIEIPSASECDEYSNKISSMMAGMLIDFTPKGCEQVSMNSYFLANAQMPIVHSFSELKQVDSLFSFVTEISDDYLGVVLISDLNKYGLLNKRIYDEFFQKLDLSASEITVVLNNDEQNTREYLARGVFLDGKPVYDSKMFALERRHKVEIELSNVGASYLEEHGAVAVLALKYLD